MISIRRQPEISTYIPEPVCTVWTKHASGAQAIYHLTPLEQTLAGWRNRELEQPQATLTMLESGALLASFPLRGALPGRFQPDDFSIWFWLDAPALVPAGIFGRAIRIAAGRHLMTPSPDSWLVFFRPAPDDETRASFDPQSP